MEKVKNSGDTILNSMPETKSGDTTLNVLDNEYVVTGITKL